MARYLIMTPFSVVVGGRLVTKIHNHGWIVAKSSHAALREAKSYQSGYDSRVYGRPEVVGLDARKERE